MWIRYRKHYSEYSDGGEWSRWHNTNTTEDRAPTLCGIRHYPYHRIESREKTPTRGACGNCKRYTAQRRRAG